MEWLLILGALTYLTLSAVSDGFDAWLTWLADHPRAALRALAWGFGAGVLSVLFKGHVTATVYVPVGLLAGLVWLVFEKLKSYELR